VLFVSINMLHGEDQRESYFLFEKLILLPNVLQWALICNENMEKMDAGNHNCRTR
jgi:hypothetical protein